MSNPRACQPLKVKALAPVVRDLTPEYEGPYTIEPSSQSSVVVPVQGKKMTQDLTVERATLEELNVTVTENGETRIEAEEGYLGLSGVNLTTNVQPALQTKSVEYTANGEYSVTADEGYDGLGGVNVTVNAGLLPSKGDIIQLQVNNSGYWDDYIVLKINGTIAEVLLRRQTYNRVVYSYSSDIYENSNLDNYLNSTFYNTLSNAAKLAIVSKTFKQDSWYINNSGSPKYYIKYGANSKQISLGNSEYGNEITRSIYVLSIQDLIDFFETTPEMTANNTTFNSVNSKALFNLYGGSNQFWLRSAIPRDPAVVAAAFLENVGNIDGLTMNTSCYFSPAFQIDLSKIDWRQ